MKCKMIYKELKDMLRHAPEAKAGFDPAASPGVEGQLIFSGGCLYTYTSNHDWQVVEEYDKDRKQLIILLLALVRYPINDKCPSHVIKDMILNDDFQFYMEKAEKLLELKEDGIMNEETIILEEFFDLPKQIRRLL